MKSTTKLKLTVLYLISCLLLAYSDLFLGSLIALGLLFQLSFVFNEIPSTKNSQQLALYLFLLTTPLFAFMSSLLALIRVYYQEQNWLFLAMALSTFGILSLIFIIQTITSVDIMKINQVNLIKIYDQLQPTFKKNSSKYLNIVGFFITICLTPIPIGSDWSIVLALTVTQAYWLARW